MKKALITGVTGQDGSYLAEFLLKKNYEVHGIVRRSSSFNRGRIEHLLKSSDMAALKKLNLHYGDMTDTPSLNKLLSEVEPDEVYNLAAQSHVAVSFETPEYTGQADAIGPLRILDTIKSCGLGETCRFYQASTSELFGKVVETPQTESTPFHPRSPYAIAKLSGEHYLRYYKENFHLDYVSLRYSNVFGPRQDPYGESGVIAIFCNLLLQKKSPIINGDGEQTRDFIYIEDVVRANILALQPDCKSGVFNIGTEKETTINNLTKQLLKASGQRIEIKYGPARKGEQRKSVICHQKIYETVGWKPNKTLEEGLIETYRYFSTFRL